MLLFSLISGQLLKNINEDLSSNGDFSDAYFRSVIRAPDRGTLFGVTGSGVVEIHLDDLNGVNEKNKLNKTIDTTKRKYFH